MFENVSQYFLLLLDITYIQYIDQRFRSFVKALEGAYLNTLVRRCRFQMVWQFLCKDIPNEILCV